MSLAKVFLAVKTQYRRYPLTLILSRKGRGRGNSGGDLHWMQILFCLTIKNRNRTKQILGGLILIFEVLNHIKPLLVAAAFILRCQPLIDNHVRQVFAHHTAAQAEHIGIVVAA